MRPSSFLLGVCACFVCSSANAPYYLQAQSARVSPLILEKDEGERRVWRPIEGLESQLSLFILKVDPHNGGSSHLVFGTEDIPSGGKINAHRHPGSDEILFLQNGLAKVNLGDTVREVHGGATVFIPAGTWISAVNTGKEAIHLIYVFSAPGFDDFMRAESVREGEKVVPLTKAEDAAILGLRDRRCRANRQR
jgi:quercetin dioxygenase-like cupin family protein